MPSYYTPYYYPQTSYGAYGVQQPAYPVQQPAFSALNTGNNYMVSVDGEMAARAWQPPMPMAPNSVIPLWDLDGQHVYFKSTDAYGRMNPIRKGRVVFDDEIVNTSGDKLNEGSNTSYASGESESQQEEYATKEDFNMLRNEIKSMLSGMNNQSGSPAVINQNGRKNSGDTRTPSYRGDNK